MCAENRPFGSTWRLGILVSAGSDKIVGFHSDHGAQYTSADFAVLCKEFGVRQSMGAVGTSLLTG